LSRDEKIRKQLEEARAMNEKIRKQLQQEASDGAITIEDEKQMNR
jgi:hypothetical protein